MSDDELSNLKPHQLEALALLAEECAEVCAVVGKAIRHGLWSTNPDDPDGPNNRDMIAVEAGQVQAIIGMAIQLGVIDRDTVRIGMEEKWQRVGTYLHHFNVDPELRNATKL